MNKKLVLLGIPMVLALAGGAHAWALHRPKMQVPSDFGQPMMVVYPQTRYIGFDKYATYKVECALRECRKPATILDTEGRKATVGVMGATTPLNLFSPDGKRVLINDLAHIYTFDGQQFVTQHRDNWVWYPQGGTLADDGTYQIVSSMHYDEIEGKQVELVAVEMNTDGYKAVKQPLQGEVMVCDGKVQVINRTSAITDPDIFHSAYFNPNTKAFDAGERVGAFEFRAHQLHSCANDGAGTAYVLTEDAGDPNAPWHQEAEDRSAAMATGEAKDDRSGERGVVFYRKAMHQAPEAISPAYTVHYEDTSALPGGYRINEHEAWLFNRNLQMLHFDFSTNDVPTRWEAAIPATLKQHEFYAPNPIVTDHHVIMIGQTEVGPKQLYALVFAKESGELQLAKHLSELEQTYRNTWIGQIDIRDEAAVVEWLKTQPDIDQS